MTTDKRGRLKVSPKSWHKRWYNDWRRRARDTRKQIDLCHYIRVLLIWAPLRWFFQAGEDSERAWVSDWGVRPVTITLMALWWAFVGLAFTLWTDASLTVLKWLGLGLAAAVALVVLAILLAKLIKAHADPIGRALEKIADGFVWLFDTIGDGLAWVRERTLYPFLDWFFMKKLFWLPGFRTWAQPWMIAALGIWGTLVYFFPFWTLIVTGGIIAGIAGAVAIVALVYVTVEAFKKWRKRRAREAAGKIIYVKQAGPEEEKGMSMLDALWQFLVAKKQRICPLIEETGTVTPKQ